MEAMIESMPKMIGKVNEVLTSEEHKDSAFAQMFRQFMNPNALQPGLAPNLAANFMESRNGEPSVMEHLQQELGSVPTVPVTENEDDEEEGEATTTRTKKKNRNHRRR